MSDENTDEEPIDTVTESDDSAHDDADSEEGDNEAEYDGVGGESSTQSEPIDVEALTSRAKAAEDSARQTQDLLVKILAGQGKDPGKEAEEEKRRVQAMSPEERAYYAAEMAEKRINFITQQSEFKIKDANDRADFAAYAAKNTAAAKLLPEVEKRLAEERAKGYNYDRKVLLTYLAGERALASAEKGGSRSQRRQASENTRKSTTTATKAVGDKKLNGKTDPNSREARLDRLRDARF